MTDISEINSSRGMEGKSHRIKVANICLVWTTLITNTKYLSGLLNLDYSLKKHGSKYPLVALYTDTFPEEGHKALDVRHIPKKHVDYILPSVHKDYSNDPRFYDCWSKLIPFSLVEFERIVQLDSDMMVLQNMDELMDLELDPPSSAGKGNKVFAASHACVCNALKKPHYPKDWSVISSGLKMALLLRILTPLTLIGYPRIVHLPHNMAIRIRRRKRVHRPPLV